MPRKRAAIDCCAWEDCDRTDHGARGLCQKHYRYWLDHTIPEQRKSVEPRLKDFWSYVEKTHEHGCWLWRGILNRQGYGTYGSQRLAHRVAWELTHGPVPDGLFICHHCDVRNCVNPAHLYPGTHEDNTRDALVRGRYASPRKDRCKNGHLKVGDNLIVQERDGYTHHLCRTCVNKRNREGMRRRYVSPVGLPPPGRVPTHRAVEIAGVSLHQFKYWAPLTMTPPIFHNRNNWWIESEIAEAVKTWQIKDLNG